MFDDFEFHSGHWKNESSGANGIINEVVENRKVATRLYEIMKERGYSATLFHDDLAKNQSQNLANIVHHHNLDNNGLVVSIHFNSSGLTTSRAIGTEVLYYDQQKIANEVAKAIHTATGGGLINRGAKKRTDLAVLAKTKEPAILIEICFVNSSTDVAIYKRDFEKICQSIVNVLEKYGKTSKNVSTKQYQVVTGTFQKKENAQTLMREIQSKGFDAYIQEK